MKLNKYVISAIVLAFVVSFSSVSCYKILRTHAPSEVMAGQSFQVKMVVVDNGDAYQKEITDWSVAAVRVPEDWDVKCGSGAYESFAEDWVYYSDGKPASAKYAMRFSESLSKAYNESAPKEGYKWVAFTSASKVTKFMSACWRNGCDSAVVTFTVTAGNIPGDYVIDYLAGDDESDASPKNYSTPTELDKASGGRMFNASTVKTFKVPANKNTSNYAPALASKIKVVPDPASVEAVTVDVASKQKGVYTLEGKKLSDKSTTEGLPAGTYIVNGKKTVVK